MNQEVTSQALLLAGLADSRGQPALAAQWRSFVAERHGGASRDDLLITAAARNAFGRHAARKPAASGPPAPPTSMPCSASRPPAQ